MKKFKYITTIVLLVCIFGTAKPNSLSRPEIACHLKTIQDGN
jgi:hypothetical protein